ncbi:MAG TPA: hypothetical protein VMW38_13225 [Terriglobia bacterium]|nr:hypothetical protein [Terriglobia bacterium]
MLERGFSATQDRSEYRITALWITAGTIVGLVLGWILQAFLGPLLLGMVLGALAGLIHMSRY